MNRLANALEGDTAWQGASYVRIEGATDLRDRHEAVKRFRSDPSIRVALLSVTAAGEEPFTAFVTVHVGPDCGLGSHQVAVLPA